MENVQQYIEIALMVIGAASAIAACTPNPKDDEYLKTANKFVNFLALNFGGAANAADKEDKPAAKRRR